MGLPQTSAVSLLSFLWNVIEYLKIFQWKSVFNFHSVSLFNCILFLPFSSIAVVLLITHVFLLLEPLDDHFFSLFLFSLKLQNCLPFLRLSIAVVLWMAHPAGEFRQRLFCWKCAFIVCDFSLALQIKLKIWLSKLYQIWIQHSYHYNFPGLNAGMICLVLFCFWYLLCIRKKILGENSAR